MSYQIFGIVKWIIKDCYTNIGRPLFCYLNFNEICEESLCFQPIREQLIFVLYPSNCHESVACYLL